MVTMVGLALPVFSYLGGSNAHSEKSIVSVEIPYNENKQSSNYDLIRQYGILDVHRDFIENVIPKSSFFNSHVNRLGLEKFLEVHAGNDIKLLDLALEGKTSDSDFKTT